MRHTILSGYSVGVVNVPVDAGGGRIIQLGALDSSELIEIAITDDTWDEFVQMGQRVHIGRAGDVARFTPHDFQAGPQPGMCSVCHLPFNALCHGGDGTS